MRLFQDWKIQYIAMASMVALVLPLSLCSALVDYHSHKNDVLNRIDARLYTAASFARAMLPDDYHDRIVDSNSVTKAVFDQMVDRNNRLCEELGLEYLWSLILVDGKPYFTTSTSPDKKVENGLHAKFFEPHSNPELYTTAFDEMVPQYQNNVDKWGEIRAVLIPHYDSHGRKYLFGASIKASSLEALLPIIIRDTLLTTLVFLIPGLLISILISRRLAAPISRLAASAKIIATGNYQENIDVQGSWEINVLSSQFNSMRKSISDSVTTLRETLKELGKFKQIVNASPMFLFRVRLEEGFPTEFISDNLKITGYKPDDLLSGKLQWASIIPPDDFERIGQIVEETLRAGVASYSLESRIIWASGDIHWYRNWNQIIRDDSGKPSHVQGLLTDITGQKKAELRDLRYQERLKSLAQDLTHAEDNERRHLAEALHDDIGQMLVALNMKLSVLKGTTDRELIQQLVGQVDELMGLIMESCKTLTWQLSPPSLYESNFAAGIEHMAEDLKQFFGLDVEIQSAAQRLELNRGTSALLFRCAKELLINVAKHSGSSSPAEVRIDKIDGTVRLVIVDQGKGFDTAKWENGKTKGFGLFSLRERLADVNGTICIESVQGHGTTVTIDVPFAVRDIQDASD